MRCFLEIVDHSFGVRPDGWRVAAVGFVVAMLVVMGATACGDGGERTESLRGSMWEMTNVWDGSALVEAAPIHIVTLVFNDGSASGFEGCNTFDFDYRIDGDELGFENVAITGRACEPSDVPRQGDIYIVALQETHSFAATVSNLQLLDDDANIVAEFRSAEALPLLGVAWLVEGYTSPAGGTISPLSGMRVGVAFRSDGTLGGHTGCNDYGAAYEVDGAQLTIGEVVATEEACAEPDGIMDYEVEYLTALPRVRGFRTTLTTLELLDDAGDLVAEYRFAGRIR